ncbi:MAG TPA: oxygenase MpaB family protein [Sphingomonas sp.]|nr:oxygenase MpaB family protein [Sphingomonas sp.]
MGSDDAGAVDLTRPAGDDGLFGPASASWQVHGDFTAMMIGGVSALLLQMLHPAALAGVWDHSGFRDDMAGRLRRTARFIAATTYGSTETAEAMIVRVKRVHGFVRGTLPDGTPYSADDPVLLTWVHVAEARSFLAAYVRYRDPAFPVALQDLYYAEMAELARRLGATDVPETGRAVEAYLRQARGALRVDHRTREVARVLLDQPAPNRASRPLQQVLLQSGVDLLPGWARAMHGLRVPLRDKVALRAGAIGAGTVLRWALAER